MQELVHPEPRRWQLECPRSEAHPVVRLARTALEHYVTTGLQLDFSSGAPHEGTTDWQLPPGLPERAGVFVTLKVGGELRGCMGTTGPTEPTLALEVVRSAILAGTADPRFQPVDDGELERLEYSVDLLHPPEECTMAELDPVEYGLLAVNGTRLGVLLPDLTGVRSAEEQVRIACQKAGLEGYHPPVRLFRFRVDRYR